MALATWWRDDSLPTLPPLKDFQVKRTQDEALLTKLSRLNGRLIQQRLHGRHRAYVGFCQGIPVAYGWVATSRASLGELSLDFRLPPLHRYLWDFATLPAYRGQGIYPHLLQRILMQEMGRAYYFWIVHAPENRASGSGIRKAGFKSVGHLSLLENGRTALTATGERQRAELGASLLGVPVIDAGLFPCWHCGGADYPAIGDTYCSCQPTQLEQMDDCTCIAEQVPHRSSRTYQLNPA